jgi:hypothetical protein
MQNHDAIFHIKAGLWRRGRIVWVNGDPQRAAAQGLFWYGCLALAIPALSHFGENSYRSPRSPVTRHTPTRDGVTGNGSEGRGGSVFDTR